MSRLSGAVKWLCLTLRFGCEIDLIIDSNKVVKLA